MSVLDDQQYIAQHDPQDALGFAEKQPEQLTYNFELSQTQFSNPVQQVVFAGMGGSSLIAEFVRTWPDLAVPFVVAKEYNLPTFVNQNTLVICGSYSGNTEETLAALDEAEAKGAMIAIIAHGGKLVERAKSGNYPLALLPECPQPRTSVFYAYRALAELLVAAKVTDASVEELEQLVEPLEAATKTWRADVPEAANYAKQLAEQLVGKTPIIYGGPLTFGAAYKWKIGTNENAKNTAWCNMLPEFNHNEFIGWSSHPIEKPFAVIDLVSSFEHPRVLKRFEVTDRLLSGKRPKAITVEAQGKTVLEHLLYLVLLGDFATTYLALLNGVNPTPVDLVEKFKKELN